jgi:hypothetical protein
MFPLLIYFYGSLLSVYPGILKQPIMFEGGNNPWMEDQAARHVTLLKWITQPNTNKHPYLERGFSE